MKTNYRNGIRIDKKTIIDDCYPDNKYHRVAISVEKEARGKIAYNNNSNRWIFLWNVVYLFADEKLFGRGPATIFPAPFRPRVIPAPAPKDAQDCQELHNAARQMKHFRGMRSAPHLVHENKGEQSRSLKNRKKSREGESWREIDRKREIVRAAYEPRSSIKPFERLWIRDEVHA